MSKNKVAVSNAETATRVKGMVLSRTQAKNEVDNLFDQAKPARAVDMKKLDKLFEQAVANQSQSPHLQREEVAKNVTEFFEKKAYLTEAQKRFPELLKVAATESQRQFLVGKKPASAVPTKSLLSGGAH